MGAVAAEPTAMEEFDNGVIADLDGDDGAEAPDPQGEEDQGGFEGDQPDELVDEPCEPEETQEAKTGPFHTKPSAKEVELHRLHHHPYRSWCPWCVRGKAHGEPHRRVAFDSIVPIVGLDYFFLTSGNDQEDVKERSELGMSDPEVESARRSGKLVKCLIMRCHSSKTIFTWVVPYKGEGEDGYVTGLIVTALRWLAYTRVIMKCDNEPALATLVKAASKIARTELQELQQLGQEHPTPYDSQANGAIESGVRNVRQDIRTMRGDLEDRLGVQIPINHPVMAWLVRHVGFVHTAFVKGRDGRTPWKGCEAGRTVRICITSQSECTGSFRLKALERNRAGTRAIDGWRAYTWVTSMKRTRTSCTTRAR